MVIFEELDILTIAALISLGILLISFFLGFYRLIKGPSLPDRVIVLDLFSALTIGMIVAVIFLNNNTIYLNIAVLIALIVFMGTVAFAKYLKKRYYDN